MAQTMLLNGVTVPGESTNTFTVSDSYATVRTEGFLENDIAVLEKRMIDGVNWEIYKPLGDIIYLTFKVKEINIVGKGEYRVNITDISTSPITIVSEI